MNQAGLIFIPDITGFTKFVNEIEILHGNEITAELIEEIINSIDIDLDISEIEGDAVLFYKLPNTLKLNEIIEQSRKTLFLFNQKLDFIQRKRICKCNACSSAKNLTLKFILHEDELQIMKIKTFTKLYGKGLIISHRMLKNNISENEYLLFTKDYFDKINNEFKKDIELNDTSIMLEGFGEVQCYYIKLLK